MPVKKAAKKVKGLSRFTKLNIVVFALLFAGIGTYLAVNSKAATPVPSISIDKTYISAGDKIVISVASTNAMYCDISGEGAPARIYNPQVRQFREVYPQSNVTYRVNCVNTVDNSAGGATYPAVTVIPAGHISISPTTVTKGQSITVGIKAEGAMVCDWAKGDGLAGTTTYNVQAWQYKTVVPSATQSYEAWCRNTATGTGSSATPIPYYVTVNSAPTPPPPPAPVINFFNASKYIVSAGEKVNLSWTASNASSCHVGTSDSSWILTNQTYNNPGGISSPTISKSTKFVLACQGSVNPMASKELTVTVQGSTLPPEPCPAGYTGTPPNCKPPTTTSGPGRTVPRTGGTAPAGASDQERPSAPANLKAEQSGNSGVDISWDASTDNVGVTGYTVERSTDGTNWEMLSDSVTDTNYTDSTAEFNTKYSYRVSAFDSAGNYSDYAVTDLNTNAFTPNVYADQDSTITSEDGIVTVNIPAGALKEDGFCEIKKDGINSKPKGYKLVAGAYTIECKNAKGDSITSFEKEATVIMDLKDFKQYKKFAAYSVDGNNLSKLNASFNDKDKTLTFKMTEFQTFAAYGAKGSSMWWLWLLILLLIGGLIFFIIRLRRNGSSDDSYYDTTNYVTMPPTQPVGPAGPQQHTSLPDMVAQGQQPPAAGYPQDPYAQQPYGGQPPAGPGAAQQPPQYPDNQQYPPQYPPQA